MPSDPERRTRLRLRPTRHAGGALDGLGQAAVDVRWLRSGSGKGTLQFNLKDVFDKLYFSGSHQFVKDWIQPGPPRTASLTLNLAF